jgi:hypothetical protein
MIQFTYANENDISLEEKENTKQAFIEKLGTLKEEFENKNGIVTINFFPDNGNKYDYTFDIENRQDFIERWNQNIRQYKDDEER